MSLSKFSQFKLVQLLLPGFLRTSKMVAWVKVFVTHLAVLQESLYQFAGMVSKEIKMSPQVIYLEYILNNRYGRTDIFISDGFQLGPWIYPVGETPDQEFFLDQNDSVLWTHHDEVVVDFIVNIPDVLEDEIPIIAATVQKYKLPGKHFVIQLFVP